MRVAIVKPVEKEFLKQSNWIENEWGVSALNDAILAWKYLKPIKFLTPEHILEAHRILMQRRTTIDNAFKGHFRSYDVMITNHPERTLCGWQDVPRSLDRWIDQVNGLVGMGATSLGKNVAGVIRHDHIIFETIHPFGDGNGRIGRMLYEWERLRCFLPIDVIYFANRSTYYQWFSVQGGDEKR